MHAFVIEAGAQQGIEAAQAWAERELGMQMKGNPDVVILCYGLLSVEDARGVADAVAGAPFAGKHKVVIIAASRVYHEAQNALLKLFEEPPQNTYLFLIIPAVGALLPTLRSRVQILQTPSTKHQAPKIAEEFIKANKEKRSAVIKRLTSGKDEEERRELRDEAITLVDVIEATLFHRGVEKHAAVLSDIARLRGYLHDRGAPVKLILEHLSLVTPKI